MDEQEVTPWPSDLGSVEVVGQFGYLEADNYDENMDPNLVFADSGEVIITPSIDRVKYRGELGNLMFHIRKVHGVVGHDGRIYTMPQGYSTDIHQDIPAEEWVEGIRLPASDSDSLSDGRNFTYRVVVNLPDYPRFVDIHINPLAGSTQDIAALATVPETKGNPVLVDDSAARRAEDALQELKDMWEGRQPHVVHLNGPEYGVGDYTGDQIPFSNQMRGTYGTDYTYDGLDVLNRLAADGWRRVKLPFRWERLQPYSYWDFNEDELARMRQFCDDAHTAGLGVILDMHNYGLYYEHDEVTGLGRRTSLGDDDLSLSKFLDFWQRLSEEFANHPAVVAYAIMAEPQDSGGLDLATWQTAAQYAVNGIREYDMEAEIHVAGFAWSQMRNWDTRNGPDWWVWDPVDRSFAEAHHYWDANGSGSYERSYADELADAQSVYSAGDYPDALHAKVHDELTQWLAWLDRNNVQGVIGEAGWPGSTNSVEWNELGRSYLDRCTEIGVPVIAWCAGSWTSTSDLRIYNGGTGLGDARPQLFSWQVQSGGLKSYIEQYG